MENFLICLNAVLPVFLLISAGYLCRLCGLLDREDVKKMNRLVFQAFMPVMMFYNLYHSDLSSAVRPGLMLYAALGTLGAFLLAVLTARLTLSDPKMRGAMIQGIYRANYAAVGITVVGSLVGEENLGPAAMVMAVTMPLSNVLAVIALEINNGGKLRPGKLALGMLKNPIILGTAAAILTLLLHIRLPQVLVRVTGQVSQMTNALMLVLLGAFFQFDGILKHPRELLIICVGKLAVVPAIFLGLAAALGFRGAELAALLGTFAAPLAATAFPMAQQMNSDEELTGAAAVATNALCCFTMFTWCLLGKTRGLL